MKTIEVITDSGNTVTVVIVDSFELFDHIFLIHMDINENLFVCTHEKSTLKLPVFAENIKEIKDASIALLLYKGKRKFNKALRNEN